MSSLHIYGSVGNHVLRNFSDDKNLVAEAGLEPANSSLWGLRDTIFHHSTILNVDYLAQR